jgi:MerR family transcriptional regulator, mercuric resistance operon regulatory protein
MTIGQLARQGGVNVETIRYYQRRGLLPVPPQSASAPSEGRVRRYDEAVLRRLRFIKSAQAAGFTLTEIAELDASSDRARARELADARIAAIEKTIAELDVARRALMGLSRQCAAADTLHCPIIAAFEQI